MKKSKVLLSILIIFSITLAITPPAIPQVGTYTFHGAPGNVKILKVRTVNNQSLEDLFGASWVDVIELFGTGAANVGARKKSLVTAVNTSYLYDTVFWGLWDAALYNTSNWDWTTAAFSDTPDSIGDLVVSYYDPTNITFLVNAVWGVNVTVQNAAALFAQLPTSVAQYLGAIVWEPKWQNIGNTVVHSAEDGDGIFLTAFSYLEDCTETWTYDETYGSWIGYKIQDNETNTIYEFSIELATSAKIPGFELPVLLSVSICVMVSLIYVFMKKRR
jgi:hypothetical protein